MSRDDVDDDTSPSSGPRWLFIVLPLLTGLGLGLSLSPPLIICLPPIFDASTRSLPFIPERSLPSCLPPWNPASPVFNCSFRFIRYHPSVWEKEWSNNVINWRYNVCAVLASPENRERSVHLLHLIAKARNDSGSPSQLTFNTDGGAPISLTSLGYRGMGEWGIFSEFHYEWSCPGEAALSAVQYIEPFIGMMRDPLTMCPYSAGIRWGSALPSAESLPFPPLTQHSDSIQSKRMVLMGSQAPYSIHPNVDGASSSVLSELLRCQQRWMVSTQQPLFLSDRGAALPSDDTFSSDLPSDAPPRRILFDLGASYYSRWGERTAAIGTSWFVGLSAQSHVSFDRFICFEYEQLPNDKVWGQIPMAIIHKYTFINQGCTADVESPLNPWNVLVQIARPQDYVMVKLDIDTPSVEKALMEQVLTNASVSSRVDEMAFEHHVYVPEMDGDWLVGKHHPEKLDASYALLTRARLLGIRMHSWP